MARANLAGTIWYLGDLARARELFESVLDVLSRTLPDDHSDLQDARQNVALTLEALGDLPSARSLLEKAVEVLSRTLPDDHPELQAARGNLATTIGALGDLQGARALQEKVLEVSMRTLPADHPHLQKARQNLAGTLSRYGDLLGARALEEQVLEILSRTLPATHPRLQTARSNLARTIRVLGDLRGARVLDEEVLGILSDTLPDEHPDLQIARLSLALTIAAQSAVSMGQPDGGAEGEGRERCASLIGAVCRSQTSAARAAILQGSAREAEARCREISETLDIGLSFAGGIGALSPSQELEAPCFVLSETLRGAALAAASMARATAGAPRWGELRDELRERSQELAGLVQEGTTSDAYGRALAGRETVERELAALVRAASGDHGAWDELGVETLSNALGEHEVLVAYRRYVRRGLAVSGPVVASSPPEPAEGGRIIESSVESLCAFVVRSAAAAQEGAGRTVLERFDLGPLEPIEEAVHSWRAAIDAADAGPDRGVRVGAERAESPPGSADDTLRELVFDPLAEALKGADRIVLVADDVLSLVPLDALPVDTASGRDGLLLGDRLQFEARCTVTEILAPPASKDVAGGLVSLGGASFSSAPLAPGEAGSSALDEAEVVKAAAASLGGPARSAAILRGGAWEAGFSPLAYTGLEAREVAAIHDDVFGDDARSIVLEEREASRAFLEELAPGARWLHVATHGWFAPESIRSWEDPEFLDRHTGLGRRLSGEEQVKGMSPMLLCGLALAGANLPDDAVGRAPGLITAEELATLDLTGCELAVLSACDTNVGVRRAGQGVASLQMALQMAGARSVITSLWKVPDEATRELMVDFYRRLWVEKKPKHRALWEAKKRLRDARDAKGLPLYTTRDWAGWVLTGEPD